MTLGIQSQTSLCDSPTMSCCHRLPQWPLSSAPDCPSYRMMNVRIRRDLGSFGSLVLQTRKLRPRGTAACPVVCGDPVMIQKLISRTSANFLSFQPSSSLCHLPHSWGIQRPTFSKCRPQTWGVLPMCYYHTIFESERETAC